VLKGGGHVAFISHINVRGKLIETSALSELVLMFEKRMGTIMQGAST
jgi:hypothetical protein